MAGALAACVLIASIGIGIYLGDRVSKREDLDTGKPPRLVVLSVATGFSACIFLPWAIANYIFLSFDLGVFTFSLALGASLYGGGALDRFIPLTTEAYRVASLTGYGAVAANYLLGAFVVRDDPVFVVYCVLGALAWASAAVVAALIARDGGLSADAPVTYTRL